MPCILVFDKYYSSTESIEVSTEREEDAYEPSTLFIGLASAYTLAAFDGKSTNQGPGKGSKNEKSFKWLNSMTLTET